MNGQHRIGLDKIRAPSRNLFDVAYALATAAVCFVSIAASLCLTLSTKKPAARPQTAKDSGRNSTKNDQAFKD